MISWKYLTALLFMSASTVASPLAIAQEPSEPEPLIIQEQGSFAAGGKVVCSPGVYDNNKPTAEGQSLRGDHLYAFYQVPQNHKALPIVM